MICNFPIDNNTTSFFVNNPNICMLIDANKKQIEIPIPGYHGTSKKVSDMIMKVGLRRSSINGMFGPYYYFGTYIKAVRYAGWTSTKRKRFFKNPDGSTEPMSDEFGKYTQGTIFRMACFLRNKRYLLIIHKTQKINLRFIEIEFENMLWIKKI